MGVNSGINVVVLKTNRRSVEHDAQASLPGPIAEIEVFAAEQAVTSEADVESTDALEGCPRDRHLAGKKIGHRYLSPLRYETIAAALGPSAGDRAHLGRRGISMQGNMPEH